MTEPIIIPSDFAGLRRWFNIMRHINRTIVLGSNQWVEIGVFIDKEGMPQFWQVSEPRNLSPKDKEISIRD